MNEQVFQPNRQTMSNKNLKRSFLSVGLLILSSVIYLLGMDSLYPGLDNTVSWTLIILFYALMAVAALLAVMTFINALSTIKTRKDKRDYIALGISALVLLAIANELLNRV